jgi:hypothetical protein
MRTGQEKPAQDWLRGGSRCVGVVSDHRPDLLSQSTMDKGLSNKSKPIPPLSLDYLVAIPSHEKNFRLRVCIEESFGQIQPVHSGHDNVSQNEAYFVFQLNEALQTSDPVLRTTRRRFSFPAKPRLKTGDLARTISVSPQFGYQDGGP